MRVVFDFAAKRAELSPDAIAFEEVETGRRLTYAEFNARAERCATALEGLGIAPGERIAILCHNSATFFEVLFGCGKAGIILVPLNWRQTPSELAPILADCGARLILHDAATADLARALGEGNRVRLISFDEYETLIGEVISAPDRSLPPRGGGTGWGGWELPLRASSTSPSHRRGEGWVATTPAGDVAPLPDSPRKRGEGSARATRRGRRTASGICSTPPAPPAGRRR